MAELRHNGAYVERFESGGAARAHLDERKAREGDAFDAKAWNVEDDRPVRLLCGGNVIETFATHQAAADEALRRIAAEHVHAPDEEPPTLARGRPRPLHVYTFDPPPPAEQP